MPALSRFARRSSRKRLRDHEQQVERPEHRRGDDHSQRHECGEPGIAGDERKPISTAINRPKGCAQAAATSASPRLRLMRPSRTTR